MPVNTVAVIFICGILWTVAAEVDPCSQKLDMLPQIDLRYRYNRIQQNEPFMIDDSLLVTNWYRTNGIKMLNVPPGGHLMCGTQFPAWLMGPHPAATNEVVDRVACVFKVDTSCYEEEVVRIKLCPSGDYVYYLPKLIRPLAAYCFGEGIDGEKVTYIPAIHPITYNLKSSQEPVFESRVQFKCNFDASNDTQLWYRVTWYQDGKSKCRSPYGTSQNEENLLLTENNFKQYDFKMGSEIQCAVRAFSVQDGPSGPLSDISSGFFVGMTFEKEELVFYEGEKNLSARTFRFKLTVPIGCDFNPDCSAVFHAYIPSELCPEISINSRCGVTIDTRDAIGIYHNLTIQEQETGEYASSISTRTNYLVYIKPSVSPDIIWANYQIPPLKIRIHRRPYSLIEGKKCESRNDPHMRTFDGRPFEMHEGEKTYIMYSNNRMGTEVQIKVKDCSRYSNGQLVNVDCNCAVAVKEGNDMYIADICNEETKLGFKLCGQNLLMVQRNPNNQFEMQVITTYGTRIDFYLDLPSKRMNYVRVFPSTADEWNDDRKGSSGLCGKLNDLQNDDFMIRNESTVQLESFLKSWRVVSETENMFSEDYVVDSEIEPGQALCVCPEFNSTSQGTNVVEEISCNSNAVAVCMEMKNRGIPISKSNCEAPARRRRSILRSPKLPSVVIKPSIEKRQFESKKIWTEVEARDFCSKYMQSSPVYDLCLKVPNAAPYILIDDCVLDILATNTTEWAEGSMKNMMANCLSELFANETLRISTESNPSIAEIIEHVACPSNCSLKGTCYEGKCNCQEGFGGSDCSLDFSSPPILSGILDDGLCDERLLPCTEAFLFGQIFADSDKLTCNLQSFSLAEDDGNKNYNESYKIKAVLDTMIEAVCPLSLVHSKEMHGNRDRFVIGYTVSISNNGEYYSNGKDLFIFDSTCQLLEDEDEGKITFKLSEGYCYIDGKCVNDGAKKIQAPCQICDTTQSKREWSNDIDDPECSSVVRPDFSNHGHFLNGNANLLLSILFLYMKWNMKR